MISRAQAFMPRAYFSTETSSAASSVVVQAESLRSFCAKILKQSGSNAEESDIVASNLVESNLKGVDSHGVGYLPRYIRAARAGDLKINTVPQLETSGSFVRVDGQVAYGQVVGRIAMNAGIKVASELGVAIVTIKNSHHLGRIGAWAEQCVEKGFSSIHFTNVAGHHPLVAPANGGDARLGTNPFTIGWSMNNSGPPIIMDYATSTQALGKVRETMARGEVCDEGVVLDHEGKPSTDPSVMFQDPSGALTPFLNHKGYSLALMCELVGGVLSGGTTINPKHKRHQEMILNSMTTIIISPEACLGGDASGIEHAEAEVRELKDYMKGSPVLDGKKEIVMPGEPEASMFDYRTEHGIPLAAGTLNDLVLVASDLGITKDEACRTLDLLGL